MAKRALIWGAAVAIALVATTARADDADKKPAKAKAKPKAEAGKTVVPDAIRVRQLERNVQELKARAVIANIAATSLKARALEGHGITTVKIRHLDQVPGSFRLQRLVYYLDGQRIFSVDDEHGELYKRKTIDVYFRSIKPGAHVLAVDTIYRGHGYSVFRYLSKYRYRHRATHTFSAVATKKTVINVSSFDRGRTYPMKQRVRLRFKETRP